MIKINLGEETRYLAYPLQDEVYQRGGGRKPTPLSEQHR